jgi:hypothetical protein
MIMELSRLEIGLSRVLASHTADRYTGILMLGKSGTGKSANILNWWQQDCLHKYAKILIEPSGFLAKDCYSISKGKACYCSLDHPGTLIHASPCDPNQISDNVAKR